MNAGEIMKLRDANSWSLLAAVSCDKKSNVMLFDKVMLVDVLQKFPSH